MRLLPALTLCCTIACTPVVQDQVSKNAPNEAISGTSLPALPELGKAAAPQRAVHSNRELMRDFLDLEFRMESGRALPVLTRFDGPITVAMTGAVPPTASADLQRLLQRFRAEARLDVKPAAPGSDASVTIDFQPRAQLQRLVPNAACFVVPRVRSFSEYQSRRNSDDVDWTTLTRRDHVAIFVPSDISPQEVRDCLHEELAQAMGPLNDLYHLPDSVFNDDNFTTTLTSFDMLMLRLHYAPEMRSGMNEAQAARVLPGILARLNPAGQGRSGGAPLSPAPRSWADAVQAAFGQHGSAMGRRAAAERMLSIAMAQGWHDGRLAFSYYARGRTNTANDPALAVAAFAEASRIYRSLPGAAVHSAHVDMQLAALALSSGQYEQAIGFVDRALPTVRQAENAALLATLMLIKAEALEGEGRSAEAKALRLDSLPWARYGFGSEEQVRARMGEIASLGSRGRQG